MKSISLRSPAKLNLYLKVTGKRKDGYHNLITLFERISLWDDIKLTANPTGAIRIFCSDPEVPAGPKNLVFQAAKLLKDDFGIKAGVDIRIQKRIPVAAGLAGGSSNAATVLIGLNKIWKLKLSKIQLLEYARKLGSDVAFFIYDCSWAVGRGRGDQIQRQNLKQKLWHVVVVPRLKVYSREVFGAFKMRLTKNRDNVNILLHALRKKDLSAVGRLLSNDLSTVVFKKYKYLFNIKEKLEALAFGASLSGSGPSIFAILPSKARANSLKIILKKCHFKRVFVVSTK